jgi:hypothetical protein
MSIRPEITGVDIKRYKEEMDKLGKSIAQMEDGNPYDVLSALESQEGAVITEADYWKFYHVEYFEERQEKTEGEISRLFDYFLTGRRISDDGASTTEYPYAYWTNDEVKLVLDDMNKDWEKYEDVEKFWGGI